MTTPWLDGCHGANTPKTCGMFLVSMTACCQLPLVRWDSRATVEPSSCMICDSGQSLFFRMVTAVFNVIPGTCAAITNTTVPYPSLWGLVRPTKFRPLSTWPSPLSKYGDAEGPAQRPDRRDLAVTRPAENDEDVCDLACAQRTGESPQLALTGLARAAEEGDVVALADPQRRLAEVAADDGAPPSPAYHAYFPPRATSRASENRVCRIAVSTPRDRLPAPRRAA